MSYVAKRLNAKDYTYATLAFQVNICEQDVSYASKDLGEEVYMTNSYQVAASRRISSEEQP